ncbi:transcriptional regulator [Methylosinus sp. R-45379]|uniref:HigA family addiction module antitoxin n=1 Tax=Methylosinus sp. R-45379 TaxID=980563 RepID=UPI0007C90436|nr:HigA family addiction module antitoxin [Methylosinus sp. R-45379]OAI23526.1 transcriptional regulator [Methylosinus sp. R-45379]
MAKKGEDVFEAPVGGFRFGPIHPGRTLAAELEARGLSAHALALKLRVPANRIGEIVAGKRGVSAETALRLGRYFGNSAAFWMNLQTKYDLEVAEREFGERIKAEVEAA